MREETFVVLDEQAMRCVLGASPRGEAAVCNYGVTITAADVAEWIEDDPTMRHAVAERVARALRGEKP